MSYACLICGESVEESLLVGAFLKLPGEGDEVGSNFLLNISPCCGKRACVEAAWEQAKQARVGDIDLTNG